MKYLKTFIASLQCKLDYLHVRVMRARLKTFSDVETSYKSFYRRRYAEIFYCRQLENAQNKG